MKQIKAREMEQIMSYNELPLNLPQIIHSVRFPVYGFINSEEFSIRSLSIGRFGEPLVLNSVSLTFSSSRYPGEHNTIDISSIYKEIQQQGHGKILYDLQDPSEGPLFSFDTYVFEHYHLDEKERIQAGPPLVWEGTLSIDNVDFSAKVRFWSSPYLISLFLLKAEKTVLSGYAHGPSYDELLHLLQSLQIINHRDELIELYQRRLDQETKELF